MSMWVRVDARDGEYDIIEVEESHPKAVLIEDAVFYAWQAHKRQTTVFYALFTALGNVEYWRAEAERLEIVPMRAIMIFLGLFIVAYSVSTAITQHDWVGYLFGAFGLALFLWGLKAKSIT